MRGGRSSASGALCGAWTLRCAATVLGCRPIGGTSEKAVQPPAGRNHRCMRAQSRRWGGGQLHTSGCTAFTSAATVVDMQSHWQLLGACQSF